MRASIQNTALTILIPFILISQEALPQSNEAGKWGLDQLSPKDKAAFHDQLDNAGLVEARLEACNVTVNLEQRVRDAVQICVKATTIAEASKEYTKLKAGHARKVAAERINCSSPDEKEWIKENQKIIDAEIRKYCRWCSGIRGFLSC
jgi:hypothetical protein